MDASSKSVLVVIPALNESETIEHVLSSLIDGNKGTYAKTYVVADGGSTDGTREKVLQMCQRFYRLHLIDNNQRLQSSAVNAAARTFGNKASILIRCDAHSIYPEGFLDKLVDSLDTHSADSVVVPMDSIGDTCFRKAVAWVSNTPLGSGGSAHRAGRVSGFVDHGHHAAFRMESFRNTGGYDESFSHNEDAELDCRLRSRGGKIFLDGQIRIGYYPRASLLELARQYFSYGKGRSRTVRKHPGSVRFRQLVVPTHIVSCVLAVALAPQWPLLLAWPAFYLSVVAAISVSLVIKHRSACAFLCAPAALTMHTAWTAGFLHGLLSVKQPRWMQTETTTLKAVTDPTIFRNSAKSKPQDRANAMR